MNKNSRTDWLLLVGFCAFLFFYGLGSFGLVGADEPRYAQVAREMLARHDWVTPTLGGSPWLEKPPLYYWQAMLSFRLFGVTDWAARIPGALDATLLVLAVYWFLRRFRPGFHLDGALITASTAATIAFARAASTDMPLAAMFSIAMLAWFGWEESSDRKLLAAFYVFCGLGMLAKGPVAPALAGVVIVLHAVFRRELRTVWRTLWLPGILSFCAVACPWYVAVQVRNPDFFRTFIIEHNLERFGSNLYHHAQPFWYYIPVVALGWIPWTVVAVVALWFAARHFRALDDDQLPSFLLVWLAVIVVFFSISQSKLPGYVLPAIPAGTLLLAEYLRKRMQQDETAPPALIIAHSIVAATPLFPALMLQYIVLRRSILWTLPAWISLAISLVLACGMAATLWRKGLRLLRFVTLIAVVLTVAAILRIGAPALDAKLSARPIARDLAQIEGTPKALAVFKVPRELEYGLAFYRDRTISRYEMRQIPTSETLLVAAEGTQGQFSKALPGRRISFLGSFPQQHVEYFWIAAAPGAR